MCFPVEFRMKPFSLPSLAIALPLLLLGACNTVEKRIEEKPAAFAAADPATQEKVRKNVVEVGFSTDLVYIALGKPNEERRTQTTNGETLTWIYNTYQQDYAGQAYTGYRRYVVIDPRTGRPVVFIEPVYTDVYREHVDERLRIIFKDGKVTSIEETKN